MQRTQAKYRRFGLLLFILGLFSCSQAISYTVQVVALSDQQAALELRHSLSRQGYPVYLVAVPTEQGLVSRVRIGAFGNRAAAVSFAETVSDVEGSMPAPALAEGIPTGLIPFEPELLASYPYLPDMTNLQVIPWADGVALRFQGAFEGEPMEASYRILEPALVRQPFSAWRAAPEAEVGPKADAARNIVRVYNFPLWPSPESNYGEEALLAYQNSLLATIAGSLDLSVEELKRYLFYTPGSGMPHLVLAERFNPVTGENARFDAVGNPQRSDDEPSGPPLLWLDGTAPESFPTGLPAPIFEPEALLGSSPENTELPDPETWEVEGDGWTARPDGAFTRLTLNEGNKSWRALAGFPLWAHGDYLLVYHEGEVQLYTFVPR